MPNDTPMVFIPSEALQAEIQQLQSDPQAQLEYIHSFSNINWVDSDEPPSHKQLYHLLTITGLLVIGYYPEGHTLGEHYIAWAALTSEANLTIH